MQYKKTYKEFINKNYIFIMAAINPIIIWLNWYGHGMEGIFNHSFYYKKLILSGFSSPNLETFPMWGYGWVLLLTENKLALLLLQSSLGLISLFYFIKMLEQYKYLSNHMITTLKTIMILAVPWYAFHALRWANSFSISFFLISFAILIHALNKEKIKLFILSGFFFGIALNFRSDYYLMPLGFAFFILLFYQHKNKFLRIMLWLLTLYSMLLPWAFYTKKATGHYLLTSTNSGHVCFIGLGNNPDNTWGIIESDGDPLMHKIVDTHFGKKTTTLCYESDQILKQEFLKYVRKNPLEYIKKCLWAFKRYLTEGTYQGEFFELKNNQKDPLFKKRTLHILYELITEPVIFIKKNIKSFIVFIIQLFSSLFGKLLVFFSILLLPFTFFYALRKKDLFFILITSALCYQSTINILCYHMPSYTTNMLLFLIINFLYATQLYLSFNPRNNFI